MSVHVCVRAHCLMTAIRWDVEMAIIPVTCFEFSPPLSNCIQSTSTWRSQSSRRGPINAYRSSV